RGCRPRGPSRALARVRRERLRERLRDRQGESVRTGHDACRAVVEREVVDHDDRGDQNILLAPSDLPIFLLTLFIRMASIGHIAVGMAFGRAYSRDPVVAKRAMWAFSALSMWP